MPTQSPAVAQRRVGPALPLPQRRITTRCSPTSTAQSPAVVQRRTLRVQGLPCPAPKEDHHKVQSHFNGPISRRAQIPKLKRLAALFPFVDFGPFSAEALGPRSARALPDTTCPPFSTVSTPPSGALGPSSGPCLADTTRLPLSTCPSRLNPKLRRPLPGTGRPEKRSAQFKAIHTHPYAHRHPVGRVQGVPQRTTITRCSPTSTAQPPPWSNARKVWVQGLPCLTGVWERRDNRGHRATHGPGRRSTER